MQAADVLLHARPRGLQRTEYERLAHEGFFRNEKVELIEGIIVQMSPIGPAHANPLDLLVERLVPLVAGRARVRVQQPFALSDSSEPEPDLTIVPPEDYSGHHPTNALLIIEVAESSLDYDRETKAPLYAAAGVPEYWIVDVAARAIEVYDQAREDGYARVRRKDATSELSVAALPDVTVQVGSLFPPRTE
jgi:Uma2 family endonuclease